MTASEAARFIMDEAELPDWHWLTLSRATEFDACCRRAAKRLDPANGGDAVLFARLQDAISVLAKETP